MGEPKAFASLSSGLLARKGAAKPAMRRQGMGGSVAHAQVQDDLGWNDMGYDVNPDQDEATGGGRTVDLKPMLASISASESPQPEVSDAVALPVETVSASEADDAEGLLRHQNSPLSIKRARAAAANAEPGEPENWSDVAKPEVVRQQEELAEKLAVVAAVKTEVVNIPAAQVADERAKPLPVRRKAVRSAGASAKGKAAFTLRIDPDRHLRLRLASALTNSSVQQILTEAFDRFLTSLPEVEAMAGNVADRNVING